METKNNEQTLEKSITQRIEDGLRNGKDFISYPTFFCRQFRLAEILRECGDTKRKGYPNADILEYMLRLTFYNSTHHTDIKLGLSGAPYSLNTACRFMNSPGIDWV